MMPIGRFFKLHEATVSNTAARLGILNEPNPLQLANIRWSATNLMDPTRENFGALRASSWLRVPELNARIPGSSSTSAHQYGFAVDFGPVDHAVELSEIMEWIESSRLPFDQVIYEYGRWIHLAGREKSPRRQVLMKFSGSPYLPFDLLDPRVIR
jgi:hypothetical protein